MGIFGNFEPELVSRRIDHEDGNTIATNNTIWGLNNLTETFRILTGVQGNENHFSDDLVNIFVWIHCLDDIHNRLIPFLFLDVFLKSVRMVNSVAIDEKLSYLNVVVRINAARLAICFSISSSVRLKEPLLLLKHCTAPSRVCDSWSIIGLIIIDLTLMDPYSHDDSSDCRSAETTTGYKAWNTWSCVLICVEFKAPEWRCLNHATNASLA